MAKESKRQKVESYIATIYDFRFNTVKNKPEFSPVGANTWRPMEDYTANSLIRDIDQTLGITTSKQTITSIIESDFAEQINPIRDWIENLELYDAKNEKDFIKEFTGFVKTADNENWEYYFKKWIVGVVANIFDDMFCKNHLCLVLTGIQGAFKTTYLELLVPKSLKEYLYTGGLDPQNKDSQTFLAEYMLINIDDQLHKLNSKDENQLKNLITMNRVKYRRPYAAYIDEYPHLASFCASVNGNEFLTDPTGNRRFLPFEVIDRIEINKAQAFDISNLYRQAYYLFLSGYKYWISAEEAEAQNEHNLKYQRQSEEEEILLEYFDVPDESTSYAQPNVYLSSAAILSYLKERTPIRLGSKKLGEALIKCGFEQKQRRHGNARVRTWAMIAKNADEVKAQNASAYDHIEDIPVNNQTQIFNTKPAKA